MILKACILGKFQRGRKAVGYATLESSGGWKLIISLGNWVGPVKVARDRCDMK